MRTVFLFIAFISVFVSSYAQRVKVKRKGVKMINVTKPSTNPSLYSIKQIAGKWQEIARSDRETKSSVDFTDTLFYYFYGDSEVAIRNNINLSLKGEASIEPGNLLIAAGDEYTIKSLDETKAVLDDDDKYIHTLIKKSKFWYENLPTDSIQAEKLIPITVNLPAITGKWIVYRRDAQPGSVSSSEALITIINIENKTSSASNGEITFYHAGETTTLPCSVSVAGTKINITTSKHSWQTDAYKTDDNEFIFGNEALIYYAKRY
jgi:hypothetical protein